MVSTQQHPACGSNSSSGGGSGGTFVRNSYGCRICCPDLLISPEEGIPRQLNGQLGKKQTTGRGAAGAHPVQQARGIEHSVSLSGPPGPIQCSPSSGSSVQREEEAWDFDMAPPPSAGSVARREAFTTGAIVERSTEPASASHTTPDGSGVNRPGVASAHHEACVEVYNSVSLRPTSRSCGALCVDRISL